MKIGFSVIDWFSEGKVKYNDPKLNVLVEKDKPKKVTPYYVEFIKDEFVHCDCIVIPEKQVLDVLIPDIEKCEGRLERSDSDEEKLLMEKCICCMEKEMPLYDASFNEREREQLNKLGLIGYKPVLKMNGAAHDTTLLIRKIFDKAKKIFFYTSGPKEVHAWMVDKGADIVTCAAKIHTDLARGFIKGDVVHFDDYLQYHSFNDCKKKGVALVVDRDYIVEEGDVIEIRFNV